MIENIVLSVTGFPNADVTEEETERIVSAFLTTHRSRHSPRAATVFVLTRYCDEHSIPYRVEIHRSDDIVRDVFVVRYHTNNVRLFRAIPAANMSIEVAMERLPLITPESPPAKSLCDEILAVMAAHRIRKGLSADDVKEIYHSTCNPRWFADAGAYLSAFAAHSRGGPAAASA